MPDTQPMPHTDTPFIIVHHGNSFAAGEPMRRVGARPDLASKSRGDEQRIAAWRNLSASAKHGQWPTLLVTSNGAARFARIIAAGLSPGAGLKLATGSYGVVRKATDGTFTVPVWGERP